MIDCIMLVHNRVELAARAVLHLCASTPVPIRFLFVDNASDEPIAQRFRPWLGDAHVYLRYEDNPGVYARTNAALAHATSELVAWCASDHLVFPGWFPPLYTLLTQHGYGWAAPAWVDGPSASADIWEALDVPEQHHVDNTRLGSSCFVMHWPRLRERVGWFDERFRVVFGDADYTERMRAADVPFGVCLEAKSRHLGSQTCQTMGARAFTAWEQADAQAFRDKYADQPDVLTRHPELDYACDPSRAGERADKLAALWQERFGGLA